MRPLPTSKGDWVEPTTHEQMADHYSTEALPRLIYNLLGEKFAHDLDLAKFMYFVYLITNFCVAKRDHEAK